MSPFRTLALFCALSATRASAAPEYDFRPHEVRDEVLMTVRPGLNKELFKEIHLDLIDLADSGASKLQLDDNEADRELAAVKQIQRAALPLFESGTVLGLRKGDDVIVFSALMTPYSQASLVSIRRPEEPIRTINLTQELAAKLRANLPEDGPENIRGAHDALRKAFDAAPGKDSDFEPFSVAVPDGRASDRLRADEELRTYVDAFVLAAQTDRAWQRKPLQRQQLMILTRSSIDQAFGKMKPLIGKVPRGEWLRQWGLRFKQAWAQAPANLLAAEDHQITRAQRLWSKTQASLIDGKAGKTLRFRLRDWMSEHVLSAPEATPSIKIDWKRISARSKDVVALDQLRSLAKEYSLPLAQALPKGNYYPFRDLVGPQIMNRLLNASLTDSVAFLLANPEFGHYDEEGRRQWVDDTFIEALSKSIDLMSADISAQEAVDAPEDLRSIFFSPMQQKNDAARRFLTELERPELQDALLQTPQAHNLQLRFAEWVDRHHPAD